jgi:AraC-like DNA-binding protein
MDGSHLGTVPHHSWFGVSFGLPPETCVVHEEQAATHTVVIGTAGAFDLRWIRRGCESHVHHARDDVSFWCADNDHHTRVIHSGAASASVYLLRIPRGHLGDLAGSDHAETPLEYRPAVPPRDAVIRRCVRRLISPAGFGVSREPGAEIAARELVLRLVELLGGTRPEWADDAGVFSPACASRLVEYIDARLHTHIGLEELAALVGLSPSHCARKFHRTLGLSLGRFINRRRVAKALDVLRSDSTPLSRVALELGFSSQSHFTRLFSEATGITPARYQKRFKPTVG